MGAQTSELILTATELAVGPRTETRERGAGLKCEGASADGGEMALSLARPRAFIHAECARSDGNRESKSPRITLPNIQAA